MSVLYFGSESILWNDERGWYLGSLVTALELFTFLVVINTLQTDDLDVMREEGGVRDITIVACMALFAKTVLYICVIEPMPEDEDEPQGEECVDDDGIVVAINADLV